LRNAGYFLTSPKRVTSMAFSLLRAIRRVSSGKLLLKNNKKKGYNLAKFSKNNNELPDEGEKKQSIQ
jgi:hypothetical protein